MDKKTALITGGAQGLGRAFTEILLENGANVCIFDMDNDFGSSSEVELRNKYSPNRVFFFLGDATSDTDIEAAIKETIVRYGSLDIFCNNAGILNERDWRKAIQLNLTAMVQNTLLALRFMKISSQIEGGVIINVSSIAGILPQSQIPIYSTTKHAVLGFSRSLGAISRRLYNVRVNCICPSFTDTPMMRMKRDEHPEIHFDNHTRLNDKLYNLHSLIGVMEPREVAECFLRLINDCKLSGDVMIVSPDHKGIVQLPSKLADAVEMCKI